MNFPLSYTAVLKRIEEIDPIAYTTSRNFIDGSVTYLSPYISRGLISTKQVMESVIEKGYEPEKIERFLQELAWRDYWQYLWLEHGTDINQDLKRPQEQAKNTGIPKALLDASTGIFSIDQSIEEFYNTGYLHNHLRMYIASISTNIAQCKWLEPAKWMYYHLLDGDWASNALSWQWVCGANSSKKYYANQENINKYTKSDQQKSFLDVSYDELPRLSAPSSLEEIVKIDLQTPLPKTEAIKIDAGKDTLLYTYYNIDPLWKKDEDVNRVLILEPSVFNSYPVSEKCIAFVLALAKENIKNVQIFVGEFSELEKEYQTTYYFKEHALNKHFKGIESPKTFLVSGITGQHNSFFSYWKQVKKQLIP